MTVLKKDKSVRCVLDYRYLNGFTLPDALGPPDMGGVIQKIVQARYITTFDGRSSYWTIPIEEKHKYLTAFSTGDQLLEWNRAPFGLLSSGASFVRAMQKVLSLVKDCR